MTVAENAVKRQAKYNVGLMVLCTVVALVMVVGGCGLTQRQLDLGGPSDTEMALKLDEFRLKSTYPGIAFIACGTFLMIALVRKRIRFKTQHKDSPNKIPGYTEIEY